jgi:hypothetical protein
MFKSCVFPALPEVACDCGMGERFVPRDFAKPIFGKQELLISLLFLVKVAV